MRTRLASIILGIAAASCNFDPSGVVTDMTPDAGDDLPDARDDLPDAAPGPDAVPGTIDASPPPDATPVIPLTCADLPNNSPTGIYTIDPDGAGGEDSFDVFCDMDTDNGGWTLVGRERANATGTFQFLGIEVGNPSAIADGSGSGLIGLRLEGHYSEFRIEWDGEYIQLTTSQPLFENSVDTDFDVSNLTSSDSDLSSWVTGAGGASFCRASRSNNVRPGDTSWAIRDRNENRSDCGCNNGSWRGRGAYYGGEMNNATACDPWGGGWAGVIDDSDQKGGITPDYETLIKVR